MANFPPARPSGGGGGTPTDLADNEMVRWNTATSALDGTGDTNTDTGVDFGAKDVRCKTVITEAGSVKVGPAITIEERGGYLQETLSTTGNKYVVVDYQIEDSGSSKPTYDSRAAKQVRVVTQPDDSQVIPNFTSYQISPPVDEDISVVYLKFNNNASNFRLQVVSDVTGEAIKYFPSENDWRKNTGVTVTAGEYQVVFETPLAETTDAPFTVNLLADAAIDLLGDGVNPWRAVDSQTITQLPMATESYVTETTNNLLSPTWGAVDSADSNVIYGGFKTTGRIRRRELDTGDDTWLQSSIVLAVTSEAAWTDWQNRETLTYGEL